MSTMSQPLTGVTVLDFSTLLPGPLCTLLLAEAGADVIKFERPTRGDEMRTYEPKAGDDSTNFVMLNRGKRSIAVDLKSPSALSDVLGLVKKADVLVEQFRPGVMDRLGLGYDKLKKINPCLVYCSITAYGQYGPRAHDAAHDLNCVATTGLLSLTADPDGKPVLPPALIADVAGGAYPAMINILLALRQRDQTGRGAHLDVAMADNLFAFSYWGLGAGARGEWPRAGSDLVTGGSPRYQVYQTSDGAFLAAAPIENRFWATFARLIGLDSDHLDRIPPPEAVSVVAGAIAQQSAAYWLDRFQGHDVCTCRVLSLEEAARDSHFAARKLFDRTVTSSSGIGLRALPVPIANSFRNSTTDVSAPALGDANQLIGR